MAIQPTFIFYESRGAQLKEYLLSHNFTQKHMGEIVWFSSIIRHLVRRGHPVVVCTSEESFVLALRICMLERTDYRLVLDYRTLPANSYLIDAHGANLYAVCYWGKTRLDISAMGIAPSGRTLSLEQVLTPFPSPQNGEAENSYLGFCMSELCGRQGKAKYEKKGVLWGKEAALIDESLIRCLHDVYGFEFYSCYSELSSKLPGVENLGRLGRSDWQQLLHDCSFVLGFGKPVSGPTILESLYYGTPLFAPARQIPEFLHDSRNINLTDTLSTSELAIELGRCSFDEDDQITIDVISKEHFMGRFNRVFSLIADDQKRKASILLNEYCLSGQMSLINTDCGAKLMSKSGTLVFEKQFNHEEAAKSRLGCEEVRFELIYIDSTFLQFRICDQRGKFLSSSPNGRLDFSRDIPKHWETFWARKTTTKNLHSCSSVIIEDFHGRQLFENYSIDIIVCSEGQQQASLFEWILSIPQKGSKSLD